MYTRIISEIEGRAEFCLWRQDAYTQRGNIPRALLSEKGGSVEVFSERWVTKAKWCKHLKPNTLLQRLV